MLGKNQTRSQPYDSIQAFKRKRSINPNLFKHNESTFFSRDEQALALAPYAFFQSYLDQAHSNEDLSKVLDGQNSKETWEEGIASSRLLTV